MNILIKLIWGTIDQFYAPWTKKKKQIFAFCALSLQKLKLFIDLFYDILYKTCFCQKCDVKDLNNL